MRIKNLVENYINNKLLNIDDLPTEINGSYADRLFAKNIENMQLTYWLKQVWEKN